jgi:hypothetical protein
MYVVSIYIISIPFISFEHHLFHVHALGSYCLYQPQNSLPLFCYCLVFILSFLQTPSSILSAWPSHLFSYCHSVVLWSMTSCTEQAGISVSYLEGAGFGSWTDTSYPDWGFSWFSLVHSNRSWTSASVRAWLLPSIFTNHSIRGCKVQVLHPTQDCLCQPFSGTYVLQFVFCGTGCRVVTWVLLYPVTCHILDDVTAWIISHAASFCIPIERRF